MQRISKKQLKELFPGQTLYVTCETPAEFQTARTICYQNKKEMNLEVITLGRVREIRITKLSV